MWIPDADDVKQVHEELTKIFLEEEDPISPPGVKSEALLESACSRPHTGAGSSDKYPSLELKLAALFHSITKNHPFHNGNKRAAIVTLLTALYRNDRRLDSHVHDDDVYDFVLAVTADEYPKEGHGLSLDEVVHEISHWIKQNSTPLKRRASSMKTTDFIKVCQAAGANVKEGRGGAVVISRAGDSVRISHATRQFNGMVVKKYLKRLSLGELATGATVEEVTEGMSGERQQIYRYMKALKRLAKT